MVTAFAAFTTFYAILTTFWGEFWTLKGASFCKLTRVGWSRTLNSERKLRCKVIPLDEFGRVVGADQAAVTHEATLLETRQFRP